MIRWFALLLGSVALWAQLDQGMIVANLRDASGRAIAGARTAAVSEQTGLRREAETGVEGRVVLSNLPVGAYRLEVEAPGFKKYVQAGIRVEAANRVALEVTLEVGAVTESVTVFASAVQLQRETALIGRTIDAKQISDLALNGRNPINLALLKAGVVGGDLNQFNPDSLHANNFVINGSPATNSAVTIDGVYAVRTRSATAMLGVFNVDSLQEVQILTANYPAEYGRVDGGQIRFVSRSGTSEFHGSVFHFFRNSAFDANSWTRNRSPNPEENSRPAPFRFNQPGFSLGGPIHIPKRFNQNRDKLFFFWAEEWIRFRRELTNTGTVPTERMRNGDFGEIAAANPITGGAQILRDPDAGNTPFPNNIVPISRQSPNGMALLRAYPPPTPNFMLGSANWIRTRSAPRDSRKDLIRLDYYLNSMHRIAFSGQNFAYQEIQPFRGAFDNVGTMLDRPNRTGALSMTSTLRPTLVNELTFSAANDVVYIGNLESSPYQRSRSGINYPYLFPGTKDVDDKIPTVAITSFSTLDGGPYPAASSGPMYTWTNNTTWIPSPKHTIKFGVFFERAEQNNRDQIVVSSTVPGGTNNQNGRFEFLPTGHPRTTGVAIGNAATGVFNSYGEIGQRAYTLLRGNAFEAFVQDSWRLLPRLSLELGLRYSYFQPWYALWNDIANFDPRFYEVARRATVDPRGGFITSGDPYNGIVLPGKGFPASARGRIPAEKVPNVERLFRGLERGLVNDYKLQFSPRSGFAYQIDAKTVVRGGFGVYQGRVQFFSTYLFGNPPNQVTVGVTNGNVDSPAGGSTRRDFPFQIRSLDRDYRYPTAFTYSFSLQREAPLALQAELAYVGKHSINLRGARNVNQLLAGAVQANPGVNPDFLRPWHGLGIITQGEYNRQSNYNSLQLSADRRFRNGLGFGLAYTFSKLIDNTETPYDAYNTNLSRSLSSSDRPHLLNFHFIYELPFFKGRRGALGLLGGWQISGFMTYRSGAPLSVVDTVDVAGVGPGSGNQPWDLVGDVRAGSARGLNLPWFNPNAFGRPSNGRFGNAGLNILRGPGFFNQDTAVFKNFGLFDNKVNAQLRAETFNTLNRPNLANPNTNPRGGFFGVVTSKTGERNLQLGLKVYF